MKTRLAHSARRLGRAVEVVAATVLPIMPDRRPSGEIRIGTRVVRYYRHWPDDPQLLADWDELSRTIPGATVFQSPAWQQATARVADALAKLRLVTVRDGDRLVAVIPLEKRWGGHLWTMGLLTTAYHDPLIAPEGAAETWAAALEGLRKLARGGVRSITFERLAPETDLEQVVDVAETAGFAGRFSTLSTTDTQITLAPTWDAYLATLSQHDRKELRRKIRKAEEKGHAKLIIHDTESAVAAALPRVLAMMEKDSGAKGRKAKWLYRTHMRSASASLARTGRLAVYELEVNGRIASGIIALTQGDRQLLWNTGMDLSRKEWSPGIVLFGMVIRRAIELGQPSINLLLGLMPYKYALGAVERPLHQLTLTRL